MSILNCNSLQTISIQFASNFYALLEKIKNKNIFFFAEHLI